MGTVVPWKLCSTDCGSHDNASNSLGCGSCSQDRGRALDGSVDHVFPVRGTGGIACLQPNNGQLWKGETLSFSDRTTCKIPATPSTACPQSSRSARSGSLNSANRPTPYVFS